MSFVVVDLGASSSRYCSDSGQISVLPNNMVLLGDGEHSLVTPDATDIESCLEVNIIKTSGENCEHFPATLLAGIMADRFSNLQERPATDLKKFTQRINYLSAILSCAVSRLKYSIDENINLYLAVPPNEIHEAREEFSKGLVGKYKVVFPKYMGGVEVTLNIMSVQCYEESFMASTSFFFNMTGIPKEENKHLLVGNVLSLDIGASTTDITIIKKGRYWDLSGQTYRIGGNEVRDYVMNSVLAKYDMDLSIEDAERSIAEGRLQQGNTYVDISDIISSAKSALAKKLITHLPNYFKRVGIDIKTINAIVVSGGGSMQSQYINDDGEIIKTSEPMSYFVTKELLARSSGTDVVPYGNDARFANVKGLFIRAKVDSIQTASAPVVTPITQAAASAQATPAPAPVATPAPAPVATPAPAPVATPEVSSAN